MKLKEVLKVLDNLCPFALQEDFDNSGLQLGNPEKEIHRIFLAFDFTEAVLEEAAAKKADLIITHHPFLFHSIKTIDAQKWQGKMIFSLIQKEIALVAMHTNLDKIDFGVNMQLGKDLGLENLRVFLPEENGMGLGAVGELPQAMTFAALTEKVKKDLNRPAIKYAGKEDAIVKTLALLGGAGAEFTEEAKAFGADVYLSSDFKYHDAQKAHTIAMNIIDAGHFGTEVGVVPALAKKLGEHLPTMEIFTCSVMADYWSYR